MSGAVDAPWFVRVVRCAQYPAQRGRAVAPARVHGHALELQLMGVAESLSSILWAIQSMCGELAVFLMETMLMIVIDLEMFTF